MHFSAEYQKVMGGLETEKQVKAQCFLQETGEVPVFEKFLTKTRTFED